MIKVLLFLSETSHACSVCGFGDDGTQWGYFVTTGIMTLLPLGLFAFGVYYVRKQFKKANHEQEKDII